MSGSVTLARPHPTYAFKPIVFKFEVVPMPVLFSEVQPENAYEPISVTESGIVSHVTVVLSLKALSPMAVTV